MISTIFNRATTQNSLYRDGAEYHVTVQVDRVMEDHTDKLLIVYTINGRATLVERYSSKFFHGYPTYCPSEVMAYRIGLKLAQIEIEDYLKDLLYAEPRNAEERLLTICHSLRHGTELGKYVNAAYPSMLYKRLRIWVSNNQHMEIIQTAIANNREGIEIVFHFGYPS